MNRITNSGNTGLRRLAAAAIVSLTLIGSLAFASSSRAVPLLFTLSGVTFEDGATVLGFFTFDPSTEIFGDFDITTTDSMANLGSNYAPAAGTGTFFLGSPDAFIFDNFSIDDHYLVLSLSGHVSGPGVYNLALGSANGPGSFFDSGEFVNGDFGTMNYRLVMTGFLTVTPLSAPDAGATLLLLAVAVMALGGLQHLGRFRLRRTI